MTHKKKTTVTIATLGCKVNQCESAALENSFSDKGITPTPFGGEADIYVINTCAVTAKAAAQSRQMIRKAMRLNPKAKIMVTGCYAQIEPETIKEITKDQFSVVGNGMKDRLVAATLTPDQTAAPLLTDVRKAPTVCDLPIKHFGDRSRPFLKIQDGCNNFCTYCIVPFARGRSRSLRPDKVLAQAEAFAEAGYKEVVITGIHVGDYGHDLTPRLELADIVGQLLDKTPTVRYRISSLEPTEITPALIDLLVNTTNLAPHLHIPLQSGDNTILQKMNRRYSREDFIYGVKDLLERRPDLAIGVDVLVGFPGEDEASFANTLQLLNDLPVAYLHVFPYSMRPGTVAAKLPDQLPKETKTHRVAWLRELDRHKRLAFYRRNLGREALVLAEGHSRDGRFLKGFTENYIPVHFTGPQTAINRINRVRLESIREQHTVLGTLLEE